jgi:hypothetical protein
MHQLPEPIAKSRINSSFIAETIAEALYNDGDMSAEAESDASGVAKRRWKAEALGVRRQALPLTRISIIRCCDSLLLRSGPGAPASSPATIENTATTQNASLTL